MRTRTRWTLPIIYLINFDFQLLINFDFQLLINFDFQMSFSFPSTLLPTLRWLPIRSSKAKFVSYSLVFFFFSCPFQFIQESPLVSWCWMLVHLLEVRFDFWCNCCCCFRLTSHFGFVCKLSWYHCTLWLVTSSTSLTPSRICSPSIRYKQL